MQKIFRPSPKSFKNTFCVFQELPLSSLEALTLQYASKSRRGYYYTKKDVSGIKSLGTISQ
jgi:hypothetical protein